MEDFLYVEAENVAEGVYKSLLGLKNYSPQVKGEDGADKEAQMKEAFLVLKVKEPFKGYCVPKCVLGVPRDINDVDDGMEGLVEYEMEFIDGTRDNDAELFGYTYHQLYEKFYDEAVRSLTESKYTRQAVLPVGSGAFWDVKDDKPCLLELMFKVRADGRLWCTAVFRSNDAVRAFPMNIWAIARLLKKVALDTGYEVGGMYYVANSFHCYPSCRDMLSGFVSRYLRSPMRDLAWLEDEYLCSLYIRKMKEEDVDVKTIVQAVTELGLRDKLMECFKKEEVNG